MPSDSYYYNINRVINYNSIGYYNKLIVSYFYYSYQRSQQLLVQKFNAYKIVSKIKFLTLQYSVLKSIYTFEFKEMVKKN